MNYIEYLQKEKNIYLNDQQLSAVSHDRGPGLVLSTAGSGKTTVITARAGKLIYEGSLERERILTITFSKLAALEMEERFVKLFPDAPMGTAFFSTIHAFAYRIVRDYFNKTGKKLELLNSNFEMLKGIMAKTYAENNIFNIGTDEIENLSSKISYVKNMRIDKSGFSSLGFNIKDFEKLFTEYESRKRQMNMIDFDDMLIYCEKLLSHYTATADKFKSYYKYIQVDEAQDLSIIQRDIINLVSNGNLFMVGDDDQSIYSFRGSNPKILLEFKNVYKNGSIYHLDKNYRCDGYIVERVGRFIEKNNKRYEKHIRADREKDMDISVKSFPTRRQQTEYIMEKIRENPEMETAILYRYNISSILPAEALRKESTRFYIKEDRNKYFNSKVLKDIISFFSLSVNPRDRESFANIYYKCKTYFTREMNQYVQNGHGTVYDDLYRFPHLDKLKRSNIKNFKWDLGHISKQRPEAALDYIRFDMGYEDYLNRLEKDGRISYSSMFLDLEITKEICRNSNTVFEFIENIEYLKDLLRNAKEETDANVILSSIHSTKGLEFDRVFLIDNNFGEFPLEKRNQSKEEYDEYLEEERRVFYVGMTRARNNLEILHSELPSRFISEIRRDKGMEAVRGLKKGMTVKHKKLGRGTIVDMDDEIMVFRNRRKKNHTLSMDLILEKNLIEIIEEN
ncbi:DNA helicase-2 / ATP-dependent DNA helicase PcrA [Dethiosulfatibacter aminovorans DSM 17477]|uniref:DNA 3'-5' helicase n=1 Tax=Dethiosulfatibacter aminovorans DSM 17477 TaxID=1121476 RepID=A0A1M6L1P1_9FIRM|nr:ATP-dependent helicase [Dethiosulfatibacter aminovorans]SHJ65059.1 DNA helicase-2 / ATP-dependent DNA helicase PcrA [Dethiosulfatibacter aminovorans DSM 17477]